MAQLDAGAQIVQLFDSWVGCLGPDDYRRYVLPHSRAAIAEAAKRAPVIHFATGNPALLPLLREAGGSVIGIDWGAPDAHYWAGRCARDAGDAAGAQREFERALALRADFAAARRALGR